VGYGSGSSGTATVTGSGSSWASSGDLHVGGYGTGIVTVADRGSLSSGDGYLGKESGSSGTATITGAGSSWTNGATTWDDSYLYVGGGGTGTLNVENGGSVSTSFGYLGEESGSSGTATITGTGSSWTNSGSLYLGGSAGDVSVLDGGTLNVGGLTRIYSGGTLTLGTSTFTSSGIVMAGGSLAASTAAGEEGGLFSANVGTVSGYGDISAPLHLGTAGQVAGAGGVLTLSGVVTGSGTLSDLTLDGGDITIGNSAGVITLEDVLVAATTTFEFGIEGTDPSEFDRLILTGDVTLAGTAVLGVAQGVSISVGSTFALVDFSGANLTGWFDDVETPSGWSLDPFSGVLTVVPEPGTGALLAVGLVVLGARRRWNC